MELLFYRLAVYQFDSEAGGQHRQAAQSPRFPQWGVVVGLLQSAKVAESPCNLISVPFKVSVMRPVRAKHMGDFTCNTRFFRNTDNHVWKKLKKMQGHIAVSLHKCVIRIILQPQTRHGWHSGWLQPQPRPYGRKCGVWPPPASPWQCQDMGPQHRAGPCWNVRSPFLPLRWN